MQLPAVIIYRPAHPGQGTHAGWSRHRRGAVNTIAYEEGKARSIISSPSPVIHHKFLSIDQSHWFRLQWVCGLIPDPLTKFELLWLASERKFNGSGISWCPVQARIFLVNVLSPLQSQFHELATCTIVVYTHSDHHPIPE